MLGKAIILSLTLLQAPVAAPIYVQSNEPTQSILLGTFWFDTSTSTLKIATSIGPIIWTSLTGSSSGAGETIPVGSILIIESGSCPTGYTETLNGKFLLGTNNANGDIGSTGGTDNITPSGSISIPTFTGTSAITNAVSAGTPSGTVSTPTFTGTALGTHAHELPFQIPTSTSIRQTASFGSGTSRAATATITTTSNTTSAAVALSQAVSAGTPAGTISTPTFTGSALSTHSHTVTATGTISQPSFTGASQENRPSFTKVIFCKKS